MSEGVPSPASHRVPPELAVVAAVPRPVPLRAAAAPRGPVLASFKLGSLEFAVDVRHVQEVVRRPDDMIQMPLLPDYVEGVIDLRGTIVPVLKTGRLLGIDVGGPQDDAKIAIVVHRGVRLGLACGDTGRVLRPRPDELVPLQYAEGSGEVVTSAVLKLPDGLLSVIDLDRLLGLHGVPQVAPDATGDAAGGGLTRIKRQRRRCISFRIGASMLAFPIEQIHEIVPFGQLEASPIPDPLTAGLMRIRGNVVPVLRFASFMGLDGADGSTLQGSESSRVIVLDAGKARIGLLVDAVDAIEAYAEEQCLRVPALRQQQAGLYAGCLDFGARGHILLLDAAVLLKAEGISRVADHHQALCQEPQARSLRTATGSVRQTYLWFHAGRGFAMPLREIREIVDLRSGLLPMPGAPDHVAGLINLRGTMVPVFDIRRFYRLPPAEGAGEHEPKVLVMQFGEELLGLRVDGVSSILHVSASDRYPVPALMRATLPPELRNDMREVVHAVDAQGQAIDLLAVEVSRMVSASLEQAQAPHTACVAA